MILPGMGIISEIITVHCRKRIFGYRAIAFSSIAIAAISFLVWGHHLFTSETPAANVVFSALTFLVAIPTAIKVFNWVSTMYKSSIVWNTPMLYAASFLFNFTIGGLTGVFLGTLALDIHLHDTYFVVAHFHYVMVGGTVFGFLSGLHYWWPKMTGKMYNETVARIAFGFVFIGFNVTFFSQFLLGSQGMPRRYYDYLDQYQPLHMTSSGGAYILGVGFVIMGAMFLHSLFKGKKASENPWGSAGYEWMTSTPPHPENFAETPVMTRGPYDYELCTEAELYEGFRSELPAALAE